MVYLSLYNLFFYSRESIIPLPSVKIRVVQKPVTKYVLVLESSSSMNKKELWKWVSKAAHKFIRNDLPDQSKIAVVTFSNDSSIEHSLGKDKKCTYMELHLLFNLIEFLAICFENLHLINTKYVQFRKSNQF